MNIKRMFTLVVVTIAICACAACSSQKVTYAEGDQKTQAVAAADPIAKDILDGMQQNDYALFSKDFDEKMLSAMTEDSFNSLVSKFAAFGTFQGSELVNVEIVTSYYRVNYKLTYTDKVMVMSVVIPQSGEAKASGLWFK